MKKVYKKSKSIEKYVDSNVFGIRFWKKGYRGMEIYKGQQDTKLGKKQFLKIIKPKQKYQPWQKNLSPKKTLIANMVNCYLNYETKLKYNNYDWIANHQNG